MTPWRLGDYGYWQWESLRNQYKERAGSVVDLTFSEYSASYEVPSEDQPEAVPDALCLP